jgi:4'-phosphopantetheinyl transferase
VSFNLAHSAGVVVCALGWGVEVGVDVEGRDRLPLGEGLVRRYCAPGEIADIEAQGPDGWRGRFLMYWTLKEAYLKARGLGIGVHLSDVCFAVRPGGIRIEFLNTLAGTDSNWAFELADLGALHIVAVAAPIIEGRRPRFTFAPFATELLDEAR